MSDEDLDLDVVDDPEVEELAAEPPSKEADARRRLEEKLEEARLKKLMEDYDFD